jgi:hypothetical protein
VIFLAFCGYTYCGIYRKYGCDISCFLVLATLARGRYLFNEIFLSKKFFYECISTVLGLILRKKLCPIQSKVVIIVAFYAKLLSLHSRTQVGLQINTP